MKNWDNCRKRPNLDGLVSLKSLNITSKLRKKRVREREREYERRKGNRTGCNPGFYNGLKWLMRQHSQNLLKTSNGHLHKGDCLKLWPFELWAECGQNATGALLLLLFLLEGGGEQLAENPARAGKEKRKMGEYKEVLKGLTLRKFSAIYIRRHIS